MKNEYTALIKHHDNTLSLLRKNWMAAKGKEKGEYMKLLNESLDERNRLMELRDSVLTNQE